MDNENKDSLDASVQDETQSAELENNGTSQDDSSAVDDGTDYKSAYENQKIRAEKAEADLKALKDKKPPTAPKAPEKRTPSQPPSETSVEETVLRLQGMDEDSLATLKKIAQVNGTTLAIAKEDPVFKTIVSQKEQEVKKTKASLPASRGSGRSEVKKDFKNPGLSKDEHKQMVKERLGQ